jgi:hypothetical protein
LDNNTCSCFPFYSGSSCGTFEGCPNGLDEDICTTLKEKNLIETENKPNNGVDLWNLVTLMIMYTIAFILI